MPTTIAQGFETLRDNLRITQLQGSTVSTRQQYIRDAVSKELKVLDSFLTGSYRRNTMIAPLSSADIDIFVVLDPSYYELGQASLLDKVKRILQKTYPKTPKISRNEQAVTITFTDFQVDVVPGFFRKGGGYLIPDTILKRWISTDPKKHVEIWEEANRNHNNDLRPLIKMIKCWNREDGKLLRSFHLEVLVLTVLKGIKISDFPSGARFVFDKGRAQVQYDLIDPAGYGGLINAHLDTRDRVNEVVSCFESAYKRAIEAERLAVGNVAQSYEKWRLIFGDYFPAYG
jgi:hypothetical protein